MQLDFNVANWNWNQYKAAGKHVVSYIGGAVTVLVAWHFIAPVNVDVNQLQDNVNDVISGAEQFAKGLAGILGTAWAIYNAFKSAHNASPVSQAENLAKAVPGTMVVTDPKIAEAVPSNAVVSNTEVKVIPK